MESIMFVCPDCSGDGKETCHNPDHGFINMLSFHDIGRIGCPVCGHDTNHKVRGGNACETCGGSGNVTPQIAREYCGTEFEDILSRVDKDFYTKEEMLNGEKNA